MEFMEIAENSHGHMDFIGYVQYADTLLFFGSNYLLSIFKSSNSCFAFSISKPFRRNIL